MITHSKFPPYLNFLLWIFIASFSFMQADGAPSPQANAVITGELMLWHRITLTFDGPQTSETDAKNPFTDYRLNVTFTNGNTTRIVPGFYAADGDAAHTSASAGNKWRTHFMPDHTGTWAYTVSFRTGSNIATSDDPQAGSPVSFDGAAGTFDVQNTNKTTPDFRRRGVLRYVGRHHMQFAGTGEYFLKGGADSPENFLGYYEFDGTYDIGGSKQPDFLHEYAPHAGDWNTGDPTWGDNKGKNIIGALNYLSSQKINSVYFITYNIDGGDGQDTWPWINHETDDRFDVSKLDQWEIVFSHMTKMGLQLHILTQENENDCCLGNGPNLNNVRKLYYRELIARFAHHPVLQWNLGEENDNTDEELESFSSYIRALDPYDHPITVHTYFNMETTFASYTRPGVDYYDTILQNHPTILDATSIQGNGNRYNGWVQDLRQRSSTAGHPWVIYGDEQGPEVLQDMSNVDVLRQGALWGNLMGGGAGVEWYFGYDGNFGDLQSEDWRIAQPLWQDTAHALNFFQSYLPFWQMEPDNSLSSDNDSFVLALEAMVYAIYTPDGTPGQLDLGTSDKTFYIRWYDPRHGGALQVGSTETITGPGSHSVGIPPAAGTSDWAVIVYATDYKFPETPPPPPDPGIQVVTQVSLIDAQNDYQLEIIDPDDVINLAVLNVDQNELNILAITNPAEVGSVVFNLNNQTTIDHSSPYTFFGDTNGDFISGSLPPGNYALTITPYSGPNATGIEGQPLHITFEIVPGLPPPSPPPPPEDELPQTEGELEIAFHSEESTIPTLTWHETTPPGDWYQIRIINEGDIVIIDEWFAASDICPDALCAVDFTPLIPFGLDVGTFNIVLNVWSENTQTTTLIYDEKIIIPEDRRLIDIIDGLIYINFQDHADLEWLRVWIGTAEDHVEIPHLNRDGTTAGWYEKASEMACNPQICTFFVDSYPTNGDYHIYLQEWNGQSLSAWSGPFSLTMNFDQPQTVQGLTHTVENPTQFLWNDSKSSTWYQIWVGTPKPQWRTEHMSWYRTSDIGCDTAVCQISVQGLPDEDLVWFVRGWGPGGFTDGVVGGWTEGNKISNN